MLKKRLRKKKESMGGAFPGIPMRDSLSAFDGATVRGEDDNNVKMHSLEDSNGEDQDEPSKSGFPGIRMRKSLPTVVRGKDGVVAETFPGVKLRANLPDGELGRDDNDSAFPGIVRRETLPASLSQSGASVRRAKKRRAGRKGKSSKGASPSAVASKRRHRSTRSTSNLSTGSGSGGSTASGRRRKSGRTKSKEEQEEEEDEQSIAGADDEQQQQEPGENSNDADGDDEEEEEEEEEEKEKEKEDDGSVRRRSNSTKRHRVHRRVSRDATTDVADDKDGVSKERSCDDGDAVDVDALRPLVKTVMLALNRLSKKAAATNVPRHNVALADSIDALADACGPLLGACRCVALDAKLRAHLATIVDVAKRLHLKRSAPLLDEFNGARNSISVLLALLLNPALYRVAMERKREFARERKKKQKQRDAADAARAAADARQAAEQQQKQKEQVARDDNSMLLDIEKRQFSRRLSVGGEDEYVSDMVKRNLPELELDEQIDYYGAALRMGKMWRAMMLEGGGDGDSNQATSIGGQLVELFVAAQKYVRASASASRRRGRELVAIGNRLTASISTRVLEPLSHCSEQLAGVLAVFGETFDSHELSLDSLDRLALGTALGAGTAGDEHSIGAALVRRLKSSMNALCSLCAHLLRTLGYTDTKLVLAKSDADQCYLVAVALSLLNALDNYVRDVCTLQRLRIIAVEPTSALAHREMAAAAAVKVSRGGAPSASSSSSSSASSSSSKSSAKSDGAGPAPASVPGSPRFSTSSSLRGATHMLPRSASSSPSTSSSPLRGSAPAAQVLPRSGPASLQQISGRLRQRRQSIATPMSGSMQQFFASKAAASSSSSSSSSPSASPASARRARPRSGLAAGGTSLSDAATAVSPQRADKRAGKRAASSAPSSSMTRSVSWEEKLNETNGGAQADSSIDWASLGDLVKRLVGGSGIDQSYVDTFLRSYRSFTDSATLFDLLARHYRMASEHEAPDVAMVTKLRVLMVLKPWIEQHASSIDGALSDAVEHFLRNDAARQNEAMALRLVDVLHAQRGRGKVRWSTCTSGSASPLLPMQLAELIGDVYQGWNSLRPSGPSLPSSASAVTSPTPAADAPTSAAVTRARSGSSSGARSGNAIVSVRSRSGSTSTPLAQSIGSSSAAALQNDLLCASMAPTAFLLALEPRLLAEQMTLADCHTFVSIAPAELWQCAWNKPALRHRSPNVCALLKRLNEVAFWAASFIVAQRTQAERVAVWHHLIGVAEQLRALRNYHTLMALMVGLNTVAVQRLKQTKAALSAERAAAIDDIEALMAPDHSFKRYRAQLNTRKRPALPYIGVYLTDLTYIQDGNQDSRNDVAGDRRVHLVNFTKREQVVDLLKEIDFFQRVAFPFVALQPVFQFVSTPPAFDERTLYRLSLIREPQQKK
jgi:RasGEF domain/RasGEF N-terminal motif